MPIIRTVEDNVLRSSALPEMTLRVSRDFTYLGSLEFDLKNVARVERHIFIIADLGKVERLFIAQFESALPDSDLEYIWQIRTPMALGGVDWQQNPYFFNNAENIKDDPGAESDHTTRFLNQKGLTLEDELMMSRFARVVDASRRHEIILFYLENVSATGHTLEEISENGDIRSEYQSIADELVSRSLHYFEILQYKGEV